MNKEISIFGASGLIGGLIVKKLINDPYFKKINIITRRPLSIINKKTTSHLIDFMDIKVISKIIKDSEIVLASIGTTQSKVQGNKDLYKKIDHDIIVSIAMACKENNVKNFSFVSSSGANIKSKNFYLNLKAKIEKSVNNLNLRSVSVFRPSLLIGKRNEFRFGEKIAQIIMPYISFIMPDIYKPIKAEDVASSMIKTSKKTFPGTRIYHYREIINSK